MRVYLILLAALLAVACSSHAPSSQMTSLVGAKKLPPASVLAKETIIISRQGGKHGRDLLNIELRPNNTIEILHTFGTGPVRPDEHVISKDVVRIDAETGERVRRMLWRIRPDGADVRNTVPLGCDYIFDAGYDTQVMFVGSGKQLPQIFGLPIREQCQSKPWREARDLLNKTLKSLPPSKTVAEFPPPS